MNSFTPLRIAWLCSRTAPGLDALLDHPDRGTLFDLAGVMSTEESLPEQRLLREREIPCVLRPIRTFHRERRLPLRSLAARREYDQESAQVLRSFGPDIIILSRYSYILTEPLLDAFPNRIINVCESDLSLTNAEGKRRFVGMHAVRDAILSGETETRLSVHYVNEQVNGGPLMLVGSPFPVARLVRDAVNWGSSSAIESYAELHRQWMLRKDAPSLITKAIRFLCAGSVQIIGDVVWIDGAPGACVLGEAHDGCTLEDCSERALPTSCPFIQTNRPGAGSQRPGPSGSE
jgi:folate-dependent phosphoribosylglycinamide formyltransferase PurN